ncbi:hypothetical protein [Glacieibacterium frigidum]|uniref:Uncharacterized protein n=1 Tax=Glacieibacterium frigidum TaxID=2593303 RepID=A0A552UG77_9SPHN|nr:hypothetical protein [Glacieibacterium frigidum]TRW17228.1 hypothetical protein FMM06_03270 [Glacieibacterium frigidum]
MTGSRRKHLAAAAGLALPLWLLPAGTSGGTVGAPPHVDAALFGDDAGAARRLRVVDRAVLPQLRTARSEPKSFNPA